MEERNKKRQVTCRWIHGPSQHVLHGRLTKPQPWSGPGRGRDGVVAGAEPPSISSSPAMELHVVGGPARGHRSLTDWPRERDGAAASHGALWITDSGGC